MKTIIITATVSALILTACNKTELNGITPRGIHSSSANSTARIAGPVKSETPALAQTAFTGLQPQLSNPNGRGGVEQVYYDAMLFMMNSMQLSDAAAAQIIAHNKNLNTLYESTGFKTVTDAIQGDGYNALWREVDIQFNSGFTPHQFYSDNEVETAASGANPEITLVWTDEVYRCAILNQNKAQ